ncbi:hypothetical protein AVMA1855_20535 [Acidovorax sp. SUPP1855]|uniref:hypothetical protein n=1 Tax=Acidovorax sp. SUPP1855 TaxID=431774 RepID=UPI0023DE2D1B|nr:hypothetical protein [Acidovorax sp. SUPP1855]GKS86581.1 hypothetical protein AVMA1855_20535 [Acidovorax sp. SUPP1855]
MRSLVAPLPHGQVAQGGAWRAWLIAPQSAAETARSVRRQAGVGVIGTAGGAVP